MMDVSLYQSLRDRIATGDVFAFHQGGLFATLISWWTHSPFTHVALCVRVNIEGATRLFLHNAEPETGVSIILVSNYLERWKGKFWWVPLNQLVALEHSPSYVQVILEHVFETLGRKYSWSGVVKFIFPWIQEGKNQDYCSQLCAEDLQAAGLLSKTQLSPGQLVVQPIFLEPVEVAL